MQYFLQTLFDLSDYFFTFFPLSTRVGKYIHYTQSCSLTYAKSAQQNCIKKCYSEPLHAIAVQYRFKYN